MYYVCIFIKSDTANSDGQIRRYNDVQKLKRIIKNATVSTIDY